MKYSLIIWSCLIVAVILANNNRIPIPNKPATYKKNDIINDSETGDKIVNNQLILIFDENVSELQQKNILQSFGGKIVGGVPEMEVYHILFNNQYSSLLRNRKICKKSGYN